MHRFLQSKPLTVIRFNPHSYYCSSQRRYIGDLILKGAIYDIDGYDKYIKKIAKLVSNAINGSTEGLQVILLRYNECSE